MRIFTLIWIGQLVSTIGSYMTFFALTLWAWEATGSATALALVSFFLQLTQIPATVFAGIIVDRFNRKRLMLLGDGMMAMATLMLGAFFLTGQLKIWHLYLVAITAGGFGQIQGLAYQASLSLILPKRHYTRASSMASIVHYGSNIVGPALAGALYPAVGLAGIIAVDLATFAVAFGTLLVAPIPQPDASSPAQSERRLRALTFGIRHLWRHPGLRALLLTTALFTFAHDLGGALYQPMILARTQGSAQTLASVSAAAGIGGVIGAVAVAVWGGPKRRVWGVLMGYTGAGLSKIGFGLGRSLPVWLPTQILSSLNFPLLGSCRSALWMDRVASDIQGRVFAANQLAIQSASATAVLIAGPLADRALEPAMLSGNALARLLGSVFGNEPGAGIAVLYTLCALALLMVGLGGWCIPQLMALEGSAPLGRNREDSDKP